MLLPVAVQVKPANVLVSANLAVIKLTDFSISSLLPEQSQGPISPEALRGTAAYISPEVGNAHFLVTLLGLKASRGSIRPLRDVALESVLRCDCFSNVRLR